MHKQQLFWLILLISIVVVGCDALSPAPTETPTNTPTATYTITPSVTPSITPSPTSTNTPTATPTSTNTPTATFTPTITPTPSITPNAVAGFRFDNWTQANVPPEIRDGIDNSQIVFTNTNNQQSIGNIATPSPETDVAILYIAPPTNPAARVELLTLNGSTGNQIYLAERGNALAYFTEDGGATGLYIVNLENGLSGRIAPIESLAQRGIFSAPIWSPDGRNLAVTLDNGYALDIYAYDYEGAGRVNITDSGSYDFYPAWSPDGQTLAFVSDRATCPSWNPADDIFCDALIEDRPIGGTVHLLNLDSGEVRQLSDEFVTEAPRWINNNLLTFAGGDQTDLLSPERTVWLANVRTNDVQRIMLPGDEDALYLSDIWSPDGERLVVQRVTATESSVVLMTADGELIRERTERLNFPRFGMTGDWVNSNDRVVLGGVGGECPYGIIVLDPDDFAFVATGSPPPSMCTPSFSPDGRFIAFAGINPNVDARMDVYSATFNGFDGRMITGDLRGSMTLIGWMGGVQQ